MAIPDSGGSSGPGFNPASKYYDAGVVDNSCVSFSGGASGESLISALWSGGGATRSAVESAMKAANPDGLTAKAGLWDSAFDDVAGYTNTLNQAYSQIAGAWSGDDADQALETLGGLHATLADQVNHTGTMSASLKDMAADLASCKASWGHDNSTLGGIGNWVTGDDDRAAANDYNKMISNFGVYSERMPHNVPTQVKMAAGDGFTPTQFDAPGGAGPGGAPSVGGPGSAAHMGDPAAAAIGSPGASDPHIGGPRSQEPDFGNVKDPSAGLTRTGSDTGLDVPGSGVGAPGEGMPPGGIPTGPVGVGGVSGGTGVVGGGGIGAPGGTTSLAGYNPGPMGGGVGAGGVGDVIPGGGGGLSSAAAGYGSESGLGGVLAGGMGSGSGESTRESMVPGSASGLSAAGGGAANGGVGAAEGGAASGVSAAEGGAAGGGARGILPMRPGGTGDDEDERERSTWLTEDEDVWGGDETASSVIVS